MSNAMLIASRFRRPYAPVELRNPDGTFTVYFFTPFDPNDPSSEHVAAIQDRAHIQQLLSIPEGYYIADANDQSAAAEAATNAIRRPDLASFTAEKPTPRRSGKKPA